MILLIVGTLLVISGSATWIIGKKFVPEDSASLVNTLVIIGIVAVSVGFIVSLISIIKLYFDKNKREKNKIKSRESLNRLVLTAMLLALASALSLVKIWQMPLGGSVTLLSMLPIAIISIEYGIGWGFSAAFIFSLIQMGMDLPAVFSWGLSPMAIFGTIALDYILAFTSLGISGIFRKKGVVGICIGIFIALCMRFTCHVISGCIIFDIWMPEEWNNPLIYSICYNGTFMLPELVITMIGASALFKMPHFNKMVFSDIGQKKAAKKA